MGRTITLSEVAKHTGKDSCWMVIHNKVYDVSKFLDEHPGGEEVMLDVAGRNATESFEDVGHSEDARELLSNYLIGDLPEEEHSQPSQSNELSLKGDSSSMLTLAVPLVLGILAMFAWKFRNLIFE